MVIKPIYFPCIEVYSFDTTSNIVICLSNRSNTACIRVFFPFKTPIITDITSPIWTYCSSIGTSTNGIGLSPDENTLYVAETEGARLYAFPITGDGHVDKLGFPDSINGGKLVTCDGGFRRFDSLAVEQNGNVCVATLMTGGITVANPNGGTEEFIVTDDPYTTNICFGGADLKTAYLTLSWQGLLVSTDWKRAGLPLNFVNL